MLLVVVAMLAAGGCTDDADQQPATAVDDGSAAEPGDGPAELSDTEDVVAFFVDRTRELAHSEALLVQTCMSEAGFRFAVDPGDEPVGSDEISSVLEPSKDGDVEYRRTNGFGYWKVADVIESQLSGLVASLG